MTRHPTAGRGKGFTTPQVDRLLAFFEQFLPLGSAQWDEVQYAYNRNLPAVWPQRDAESLRRNFFALKNARKPTGDPTCPPVVRRAKAIYRDIEGKCSVVELDDDAADSEAAEFLPAVCSSASTSCNSTTNEAESIAGSTEGSPAAPIAASPDAATLRISDPDARGANCAVTSATAIAVAHTHTKATSRTVKTPEQLAALTNQLKRQRDDQVTLSHTARTKLKIDSVLQELTQPSMELPQMLLTMDERAHQRELRYRQEKEEREAKREEERLRLRESQAQRELERAEREAQRHEMLMAMLAAALSKK